MATYVIGAVLSVKDPEKFAAYQQVAGPTVALYGGKILGGGTNIEVADGTWLPIGMVVIEFESMAKAKEWYTSPEYTAVKSGRLDSTDGGLVFLDAG